MRCVSNACAAALLKATAIFPGMVPLSVAVEMNGVSCSPAGAEVCEELIKTALSVVEVLSQHHALIAPHHRAVSLQREGRK